VLRNRGAQNQQYSLRKTWLRANEKSVRETLINLVVYEDFWRHDHENPSKPYQKPLGFPPFRDAESRHAKPAIFLKETLIWGNEKSARETLITLVVCEDFLMQFRENDPESHRLRVGLG